MSRQSTKQSRRVVGDGPALLVVVLIHASESVHQWKDKHCWKKMPHRLIFGGHKNRGKG